MTYVYQDGIWQRIGSLQVGWSRGGVNIFGDTIPAGDTWGNAVREAAIDLGPGIAGNLLFADVAYSGAKVVKDLFGLKRLASRKRIDYVMVDPSMYRQAKRLRPQDVPASHAAVAGAAAAGQDIRVNHVANYHQSQFSKTVMRGRPKKSLLKRVANFMRNNQYDFISRWQSLTVPYPSSSSMLSKYLANVNAGGLADRTSWSMPAYCFNLSCNPYWNVDPGSGASTYGYGSPMYRLVKDESVAGTARQWTWQSENGVNNAAAGTGNNKPWQPEHYDGGLLGSLSKYRHDWSQIKMIVQGRNKFPTRVHLYVVSFPFDGVGPKREYTPGYTVDEDPTQADNIAQIDYFWERFMEPKVVHPLSSTKKTGLDERHMYVYHHEVLSIGPELTVASDANPLQIQKHLFIRNGREYTTVSPVNTEQNLMPVGADPAEKTGIKADQLPGFSNVAGSNVSDYFPKRSLDRWLLIVAENYVMDTGNPDTTSVDRTPSFDIVVRSKYTYFQDGVI